MNREKLVGLIKIELLCTKEHTINLEEQGDYVRYWITCADETFANEKFLKVNLTQEKIRNWQIICLLHHRIDIAPDVLADAIIAEAPHILGEPEESPFANTLHGDIRHVLNKWSQENHANIPDNIMATFVLDCLKGLNTAVRRQNAFFGFKPFADHHTILETEANISVVTGGDE